MSWGHQVPAGQGGGLSLSALHWGALTSSAGSSSGHHSIELRECPKQSMRMGRGSPVRSSWGHQGVSSLQIQPPAEEKRRDRH